MFIIFDYLIFLKYFYNHLGSKSTILLTLLILGYFSADRSQGRRTKIDISDCFQKLQMDEYKG